jgi:tetratricopeptide (TPR) repeat protein
MSNETTAPGTEIRNRQIRVFLSSTFRDMQAERDYLVKFTFLELRRLCESRGVTWGEVDLRWGVTDEQKAEGKVLPICLEEIKRCRPYFIGLLGDRYGWIPETIPEELLGREPWLREQLHDRKSVTELEIIHGLLREKTMQGHAYFYFRDPGYVEHVPGDHKHEFVIESSESADKLHRLKNHIRRARNEHVCELRENYGDPKQLGDWILEDFTRLINELFPEGLPHDPLAREALDHEAFARSRERVYIGRKEYFDQLNAYADGGGNQPLVVLGESGSGKSALLANWTTRYRQAHPDVFLLEHYIGATPYSADGAAMLRRVIGEFVRRFKIQQEVPSLPDELGPAFANSLHMAATKGRVVLILDALNQLEDRNGASDLVWLPPVLPENVRLIVSTLPGRSLEDLKTRGGPSLEIQLLDTDERRRFIEKYLAQYTKILSGELVEYIAGAPQAANPLYLGALLEELRIYGDHFKLRQRIEHYLAAASGSDLYERILERWERDYEGERPRLVQEMMSLLWAARRGLSEAELLDLLRREGEDRLPQPVLSPLRLAAESSLFIRSGLIGFGHEFLLSAVKSRYGAVPQSLEQAHLRLAEYFESRESGPRKAEELPWHLLRAKKWVRLAGVLSDLPLLDAINSYDAAFYWQEVEGNSGFQASSSYRFVLDHMELHSGYLDRVAFLLALRGNAAEGVNLLKFKAAKCRKEGNWRTLTVSLGNLAVVLSHTLRLDEAVEACREQEQIARENEDPCGRVWGLSTLGRLFRMKRQFLSAVRCLEDAVQLAKLHGIHNFLGNALVNLGAVYFSMALLWKSPELKGAIEANEDALRPLLENQNSQSAAEQLLDQAMALYREVEILSIRAGDMVAQYRVCINQADVFHQQGQLIEAEEKAKRADRISRELGSRLGLARSLDKEAELLHAQGQHSRALVLLQEQEQLCRARGGLPKSMLQACLSNQGLILQTIGEWDEAIARFREQASLCREEGMLVPPCRDWRPIE